MTDTLVIYGNEYTNVTGIKATDDNDQVVKFVNTNDATATAAQIASGATAYVNGVKITGTASGGSVSIESLSVTENGIYTAPSGTAYTPVTVAVASGGTDTSDATMTSGNEMLYGITAYSKGTKYTGTIESKTSSDVTVSGDTVNIPVGHYATAVSKSVASGTEGTPTATKGTVSSNSVTITPSVTNVAGYISGGTHTGTAISVSASELVSGTKSITANGTGIDVTNYAEVDVAVPSSSPSLQDKTKSYTPTETAQSETVSADTGYDGLGEVSISVGAISSTYVGSGIDRNDSSDLTVSGATVTAPSGYYSTSASKTISGGSASVTDTTITSNPSVSIDASGLITATVSGSQAVTPSVSAGYISTGTSGTITVSGSGTKQLTTQAGSTITPTESSQVAVAKNVYTLGAVNVGAISSTYVGSGISQRTSSDLTVSGATVSVPSGYYASAATKSVSNGTAQTPATTITANPTISVSSGGLITATTSATQNVTPTVSAGYVSSGTAGSITVSGSNTSQLSTQAAATITPSSSQQTAVAAGKYTTGAVTVAAIPAEYIITSDATAVASDIAYGKTAYVNGSKITGTDSTYVINLFEINDLWTPSCSISDIVDACNSGMTLMLLINGPTSITGTVVDVTSNSTFWYTIVENNTSTITIYDYYYNSSGVYIDYSQTLYRTSDATASSSDVTNGKTFYNSSGKVTGALSFVTYYTGSSTPSSSLGQNGDIYLKTS